MMENETRYQRVAREQIERQHARAMRMLEKARPRIKRSIKHYNERRHNADHVDGFDRDDLGESRD